MPQIAIIVGSIAGRADCGGRAAGAIPRQECSAISITILGSVLLGPPLAFAGYTFLRDDELEPYRGTEVLLRSLACGLVFAAIWGAYWFVFAYFNPEAAHRLATELADYGCRWCRS